MPDEYKPYIFERFKRADKKGIKGTGLGLAITKQLTELMGGRIIVHTVYGQGSKFTVVINQKIETEDLVENKNTKIYRLFCQIKLQNPLKIFIILLLKKERKQI